METRTHINKRCDARRLNNLKTKKLIKMKSNYFKMLALIFVISLTTNNLFAQGPYINVNLGYGFMMSSQNVGLFYNTTQGNNSTTIEQINLSLGKGVNVGAAFGYMFNNHVGAELWISYLLGGKTNAKDDYPNGTTDYEIYSRMVRIKPSVVIASGFEKVNLYAKFGVIIGTGSMMLDISDNDDGDIYTQKAKFNGGVALGLSSAVGALFNLSEKVALFAEFNAINMSYAPTMGEITEATYNGVNELPDLTTSEKQVEFVDSYTYSFSSPPPDSQPSQELKEKFPFGSFGINFGCRINL